MPDNPPKRGKGRPKKSDVKDSLAKEPSSPSKPLNKHETVKLSLLDDQTREAQVMRYLIAGYGKEEIAEELGITPKTVRNIVATAYDKLDRETLDVRQNWISVSLSRTEFMLKQLMDRVMKTGYDLDKSDVDMLNKLIGLQSKILGYDSKAPAVAIQNNYYTPQLESDSEAYRYSLANNQHEVTGNTMDGLQDYVVESNSMIGRLDGLLDDT